MYLRFSNLNSIHWIIKRYRPLCTFQDIFRTFHDNFQVKLFPPKNICFIFFLKYFELNPLNNKKDNRPLCTFQDIFMTFQVNFQDISVIQNNVDSPVL